MKNKLYLALLQLRKRHNTSLDFGGNIFLTRVLLQSIYQVTWEAASFEQGPEEKEALLQVQVAVRAALPLGSYDPTDLLVFKLSVAEREMLFGAFGRSLEMNYNAGF